MKNDETYGANLFIKMLLKVADAAFQPVDARRYTKEMHANQPASAQSANFQTIEIDVIPCNKLWKVIIEILEKNKSRRTS